MLYKTLVFLLAPIFRGLYRLEVTGTEHIPDGAAVVCCNHTSLLDPILLACGFGYEKQLCFMAKKELFQNKLFGGLLRKVHAFPVDRGNVELVTIRHSINLLKEGKKLGIFPEGRRVLPGEETNGTEGVKTGVAMIAMRAGAPIVPVYLSRKKRMFAKHSLIIGKPIIPEKQDGGTAENYQRIATEAFQAILNLGDGT